MANILNLYKKYFGKEINLVTFSIVLGFAIPFISWLVEIIVQKTSFTLASIIQLHKSTPALIIIDLLPVILI